MQFGVILMNKKTLRKFVLCFAIFAMTLVLFACTTGGGTGDGDDVENPNQDKTPTVSSIAIDSSTVPTSVFAGNVKLTSIKMIVTYTDGTVEEKGLSEEYIAIDSKNKITQPGTHTINVVYQGCMTSFKLVLLNPQAVKCTLTVFGGIPVTVDGEEVNEVLPSDGIFTAIYDYGTEVVIEWVEIEGKTFGSWKIADEIVDTQSKTTVIMNANYEYVAVADDLIYTVTFVTYKDNTNIAPKKVFSVNESDIPTLDMDDYVFVGWTTEEIDRTEALSGDDRTLVNFPYEVDEDVTFYAVWMPIGLSYTTYTDKQTNVTGYQVVRYNGKLTELDIPTSYGNMPVLAISKDAFDTEEAKRLTKISISANVIDIEQGTFRNCSALKEFYVDASNKKYSSESGVLYMSDKSILVAYPASRVSAEYELEANVTRIYEYAFYNAVVGKIIISKDVSQIGNSAFDSIHIDYIDFSELAYTKISAKTAIGSNIFSEKLKNVFIATTTEIQGYLNYSEFKKIESKITNDETILSRLFVYKDVDYSLLYRLTIGEYYENTNRTAEIIGINRSVKQVNVPDTLVSGVNEYVVSTIGYKAFKDCYELTDVVLPKQLEKIHEKAFDDTPWANNLENASIIFNDVLYKYIGNENIYDLPSNVVRIAESAFENNANLEYVNITNNTVLTKIGALAFYNCVNLRSFANTDNSSLYIKNNLTTIGEYAFACTAIKTVASQSNLGTLQNVADYAFADCYYLLSVDLLGDGLSYISNSAFYNAYSLCEINVSNNNQEYVSYEGILYAKENGEVTTLYSYPSGKLTHVFNPNNPIDSVELNVSTISNYALNNSNVTALVIDESVKAISENSINIKNLVYVEFTGNPTINNLTYRGAFRNTSAKYFVFSSEISDDDKNTFFGGDANLKDMCVSEVPCEFFTFNSVVYAIFEDGELNVVAADRTVEELTISSNVEFNSVTYSEKSISQYSIVGYYVKTINIESNVKVIFDNALALAKTVEVINVGETNKDSIPTIYQNSLGDSFDKGTLVYIECDPEEEGSYFDKWADFLTIYNYLDENQEIRKASKYLIYQQPFIVLTYVNDDKETITLRVISGEINDELDNLVIDKPGHDISGWIMASENHSVVLESGYIPKYNFVAECVFDPQVYELLFVVPNHVELNFDAELVEETDTARTYKANVTFGQDYDFTITDGETNVYVFNGWLIGDQKVSASGTWAIALDGESFILNIDRTKRNYLLIYDTADREVTIASRDQTVYFGENYTLDIPSKVGYEFLGWYVVIAGKEINLTYADGTSIHEWGIPNYELLTILPRWKANSIEVVLMFDDNTIYNTVHVEFNASDYVLGIDLSKVSADYVSMVEEDLFAGWQDAQGNIYTDSDGNAIIPWRQAQTTVLYAIWPEEVSSLEQLKDILARDMSISIVLTEDIIIDECLGISNGEPIPYEGVFNGNGHIVTINQTPTTSGYVGIFALNKGTIKNLTIEYEFNFLFDSEYSNATYVGAIASINSGIIEDVEVNVNKVDIKIFKPNNEYELYVGSCVGINNGEYRRVSVNVYNFSVWYDLMPYNGQIGNIGTVFGKNTAMAVTGSCKYVKNSYIYYIDDTVNASELYTAGDWNEVYQNYYVLTNYEITSATDIFDVNKTYYLQRQTEEDCYANKTCVSGTNTGKIDGISFVVQS